MGIPRIDASTAAGNPAIFQGVADITVADRIAGCEM
jgi:hypothetical protein